MGMCGKKRARGIQAKTTRAIWEERSFVCVCVCVCVCERTSTLGQRWESPYPGFSVCVCTHSVLLISKVL